MLTGADPHIEYLLLIHIVKVSAWGAMEYITVSAEWFNTMTQCQLVGTLTDFNPVWGADVQGYIVSCKTVDLTQELAHINE